MRRLLLLLGVFGALASAQSYRVVDARGKVVEVRSVERIVSLDGITTEILFALGVGEKVVGRDDSSYYPPEAQRLPSVGYQFRLSAEGILSLKPTLVIGREDVRPKEVVEQLERAGVAVVLVPTEPSVEGAKAKIRTVAQAVGRVEQGEALVRALERDLLLLRAFQAQHAAKGKLRALFLYLRGPGTTFVCGEGSTPWG